jgi:protein FrlC
VYSFVYTGPKMGKRKGTRDVASPLSIGSSGGRIRTSDLRVMSPTSYQAALPRDHIVSCILDRPSWPSRLASDRLATQHVPVMRLAFSTNAFVRFSLDQALRDIRAAGFAGVEILADRPHAYPADVSDQTILAAGAELARLGLAMSNVNANCTFGYWKDAPAEPYFEPSLISPEARHRVDRIELIGNAMQFATGVGAKNISITSGRMLAGMPPGKAAGQFEESIHAVLELADRYNIDVGIECEPGLFIEYVAELREWIDRIGHPRLGANLDIGHCQVIGESIPQAIELLGDRIWNLHVEDIPGRKHYHLIPGQGTVDWAGVKSALRGIGYRRFLTVELYTHTADPQSAARQSWEFLSRWLED